MKRTSVKPRNGKAVGRLRPPGGPKKADNNLTCGNVAPGSTSKSGDMQANGYCMRRTSRWGTT
jgi:hypothetical protein